MLLSGSNRATGLALPVSPEDTADLAVVDKSCNVKPTLNAPNTIRQMLSDSAIQLREISTDVSEAIQRWQENSRTESARTQWLLEYFFGEKPAENRPGHNAWLERINTVKGMGAPKASTILIEGLGILRCK